LTTAERRILKDPDFVTEDEADLIMSDRAAKEPGKSITAEYLFAEMSYVPRSRHPRWMAGK
jgi:hypothetical protein